MSESKPVKKLGEILLENGMISQDQLDLALADQKKNGGLLGEILVGWGYTTEEAIVQSLVRQYSFPTIRPADVQPNDEVIKLIPKDLAGRHSLVGLDLLYSVVTVAMSNPLDTEAVQIIEKQTGHKVKIFICTYSEVLRGIEAHYQVRKPGST